MPAILGAFWRRMTASGAIAAMVAGAGTTLFLYLVGKFGPATVTPDELLNTFV